jgi:hypothetical protein
MAEDHEYQAFQKTDRQFRDRSADLLRSDSHNFGHALGVFMRFLKTNPVLAAITAPYFERDVGLLDWEKREGGLRGLGRTPGVNLPLDDDERLALLLQLLGAIDDGNVDVLHIAYSVTWATKYDDIIRSFNDKYTKLVVRALSEMLREMAPQAPQVPPMVIRTGAGSTNAIAVGNQITQTVSVGGADLEAVVAEMKAILADDTRLAAPEKAELLDDVEIMVKESRRTVPRTEIVLTVLQSLASLPQLVELARRAAALFRINF